MKKILLGLALALLAAPAFASTCASYPYTLTNGQTADATQVMANFNSILSCANTNVARAGANSDITSLSGLLTPLSAAQGGTGQSTSIFGSVNSWTGVNTFTQTIVGNTSTSTKWAAAIALSLTGPVTGSGNVDGSGAVAIATTIGALHVRNQVASGTGTTGETFTNAGWTTMALSTSVANAITGASLAANLITLPAGTYSVVAQVPFFGSTTSTNAAACRMWNNTDSALLVRGSDAGLAALSGSDSGVATIAGIFTLAASKAVALQCRTSNSSVTVETNSGPTAIGDGTPEIFENVLITKLN